MAKKITPRFTIGSYVRCKATVTFQYEENAPNKIIQRMPCNMTGWIIGATVRYTGKLVEKPAQRQNQHLRSPDEALRRRYPDSGYTLKSDNKYFVWKITKSLMTTPLPATS